MLEDEMDYQPSIFLKKTHAYINKCRHRVSYQSALKALFNPAPTAFRHALVSQTPQNRQQFSRFKNAMHQVNKACGVIEIHLGEVLHKY